MYSSTLVLLFSCILELFYSCTLILLYVIMYSCTLLLLYSCTLVLYSCTLVLMYSCTLVILYSYTLVLGVYTTPKGNSECVVWSDVCFKRYGTCFGTPNLRLLLSFFTAVFALAPTPLKVKACRGSAYENLLHFKCRRKYYDGSATENIKF